MDREAFWSILDRTRAPEPEAHEERLREALGSVAPADLMDFERHASQLLARSYSVRLWGAAYLINGGCSDDGFDYFLGWLVSEGRQRYAAALADPRAAAEGVDPDGPVWCEGMWGVASRAFAAKTGESSDVYYEQHAPAVPRSDIGPPFDEDTLEERYPEVAARFS